MIRHLCLVGPTASGKTGIAIELASAFPEAFEIVSADSMAVYRGMDIGTATPSSQERAQVPHHMIDVAEPSNDFTLTQFQEGVNQALTDIETRGKRAIIVGGTGLYVRAIVDGFEIPPQFDEVRAQLELLGNQELETKLQELDPLAATRVPSDNRRRLIRALEVTIGSKTPFSSFGPGMDDFGDTRFDQIGIWLPREISRTRIEERIDEMIKLGWIEETRALMNAQWSRTARQAIGYKQWQQFVAGELDFEDARSQVVNATRTFARKQRMWFKRDPRINWFGVLDKPRLLIPVLMKECRSWLAVQRSSGG